MIYAILLLATIFRLIFINQSFWLDEAASLVIARQPLGQLLASMVGDFHPPFYYLFLHFWLKLGFHNELFLRLPGVFFGVLTVFVIYKLVQLLDLKKPAPLLAALFLALNPLHIYYSQELRMYGLNTLLAVASWFFLLSWLKNKRPNSLVFYIFTSSLNLYTFYAAFFNVFAQLIFVIFKHRNSLKSYLLSLGVVALSFAPWLPTLFSQFQGSAVLKNLPGWSQISGDLSFKSLLLIPTKFSFGRLNFSENSLFLIAGLATTIYFFSLGALSLKNKKASPLIYWLVLPLLLAVLIATRTPILGYWRYLFLLPAFTTLIAVGVAGLPRSLYFSNLFVIVVTLISVNLIFFVSPTMHRENWRAAAAFLTEKSDGETPVLFAFPEAFAPLRWYAPALNYKTPTSTVDISPETLDLNLSQATLGARHLFYLEYLTGLTDPTGNIRNWLTNAGYNNVATHNFNGVGLIYEYQVTP